MKEEKVQFLPAHSKMTVDQTLAIAKRRNLQDILIGGYGEDGELVVYSSHMSRKDALWLAKQLELHALDI